MDTLQNIAQSVKESATTAIHKTEDFLGIPHEMTEEEARRELELKAMLEPESAWSSENNKPKTETYSTPQERPSY
jgi:hypothetical protein